MVVPALWALWVGWDKPPLLQHDGGGQGVDLTGTVAGAGGYAQQDQERAHLGGAGEAGDWISGSLGGLDAGAGGVVLPNMFYLIYCRHPR